MLIKYILFYIVLNNTKRKSELLEIYRNTNTYRWIRFAESTSILKTGYISVNKINCSLITSV